MKRPHILLVNPWIHDFAAYDLWARPLGLLVLGSWLRESGCETVFVDCLDSDHPGMTPPKVRAYADGRFHRTPIAKPVPLEGIPRTYGRYGVDPELVRSDLIAMDRPDAILVTSFMTYWYTGLRETVLLLREVFPTVPILLGGVYASLLPEHASLHCQVDEVIAGPGEFALPRVLSGLLGVELHPPRELLFRPALDLMRTVRFLPLVTSRGCPFRCAYCASERLVPHFVRRPADDVIREVEAAVLRYDLKDVALYDDAFLVDSSHHALPILDAVAASFPGLRWHTPNGLHAAAITRRVAMAMKRAGFETVRLGLESSSDEFHAETGGKTSLQAFVSAVRNLTDAGFSRDQIGVYLLAGLPGQTRDQIEDDVAHVLRCGALPKLAEYSPIPGTAMWPDALKTARFPIDQEPLFHNCTLLPSAGPGVDAQFIQATRRRIRAAVVS